MFVVKQDIPWCQSLSPPITLRVSCVTHLTAPTAVHGRPPRTPLPETVPQAPGGRGFGGAQSEPRGPRVSGGYSTGVVDAHEHGDAAHDAGPLPLELVGLPEVAVDAGVQQPNHSCKTRNTIAPAVRQRLPQNH